MKRDKTGRFTQSWNGESKQAAKLSLTNTAWQLLEQQSRERNVSRSELVERYARHFQCHCCARNKTASGNGKVGSLSQAGIAPDTQSPEPLLATQIAALQQQNGQLQDQIAQLQQRIDVLRSQEQRLRQIADAVPHMVWTCQPNGEVEYFNQQSLDAFGITLDQLLTEGWQPLVHPDDLQRTIDAWITSVTTETHYQLEYRLKMADGSYRWYLAQALPDRDETGQIIRWLGTCTEIDDRKRLEQRLQQQADRQTSERQWLEAVLNLLPTPLILVDPEQQRVTFSNQAANAIAGVDIANDVGATYNEDYYCTDSAGQILPPDQVPAARAAQGEKITGAEINWHTPVGVFPLLVYADVLPAMYDRPLVSVVVFQDIRERKQIEEQLKESQRFIRQVADATPGILYIYDLIEQRNVYVNRQIGEILGYTTDEIQAMGNLLFPTLMHPDDLATLPAHMERFDHAQDGDVIEREYRMRHTNGEWRWLWSRDLVFSRTEAGTPHQVIGISHDMTDRKQAELSLRTTEERLSLVLQATNDAIYDRNLKTDSVWWNPAYDQLVGQRPLAGESSQWWVKHLHPDDRERVIASFEAALTRGDQRWSDEYRHQRADGQYANVIDRAYILRDENGVPARYLGAISDVTHIKQVEENLKQMEERLQLALSSARMVAWDVDLQTYQVICSPNALDVWGIQAGTAEDFFSSIHSEDRERIIQDLERAKAGKEQHCQEYRIIRPDQTISWLNSQGRVYFDQQGQATRFVGVSVDISERKRVENERKQAEEAAARSADRTARLQNITAALSEALTSSDVATVIVEQALAALGACRGLVMLLNTTGEELELLGSIGHPPNALSMWQRFPITSAVPLAHVVQTQTPVFLQSLDEAIAAYPQLASLQNSISSGAIAAIPLIAENKVLGSLGIGFREAHSIHEADRAFILALAHHCAQAIRRAQLYQAEQEARALAEASEQRFRCLAESIPPIVWVAQANGFTEYYNQRWFQYTGLTLEESQNANGSFRHPDDNDRFLQAWIKAVTHKETLQAEQRLRRVDGVYRWHLTRAYPLLNENGEIAKWFGTCTDIDDWKRMEQTQGFLAQASQTFAAANLDLQTILDTVTRLASELAGDVCVLNLMAEDQRSLNHVSCYHPDPEVRAFVEDLLERYPRHINEGIGGQVMQTGEPLLMPVSSQQELSAVIKPEYRLYLERFQIRSTLLVPLKVQGQPIGVLSFTRHAPADPHTQDDLNLFQDLADRAAMAIANARLYQQAEQARQRAERTADRTIRLQAVTAALSESLTPVQVVEVIAHQTIAVVNAASVLVALVTPQKDELEIIHHFGNEMDITSEWRRFPLTIATPLTDAVRTGQPVWEETLEERIARYPHLAKNYVQVKHPFWISLPLVVEGQAVGGISVAFAQLPQLEPDDRAFMLSLAQQCAQAIARAQLYEAEQRARSQAEAANRMKDEFLAVLSHELRTPMNPILGWSRLLQRGNLDASKTAIALETIERNAKLQVQLIEDLLDTSRILQGKLTLNRCPVSPASIIGAAIDTVRLQAEAKLIQIQTQIAAEVGLVLGDVARLQQVIWNLLSNAVKFTPKQGQIEIQLAAVGGQVQIQVKDTGKGISAEFLPFVFDTFRQADSSTTRTFGGLGLGLAIAHNIIELHGGTIHAESAGEGQGATFIVKLPLVSTSTVPTQEAAVVNHTLSLQGIKVLAVDDEIDNLELATFILEDAGASVVAVSSAPEALQVLAQAKPNIFLFDLGMPQMDGYTLLRQIRTLEAERGDRPIPAIALTAYAGEADQQQALATGFQQHIPKPVEPEVLLQAILNLIGS
jgi:PAS domain S-box-containing protein